MILRTLKDLTPLRLRLFLKERLPRRLVGAVATTPLPSPTAVGAGPRSDTAQRKRAPIKPECPICGTPLTSSASRGAKIICTGCGSSPQQRRFALAVYFHAQEPHQRLLVLGSNTILRSICDGMANVCFANGLADIPEEWHGTVDLCLHSDWLNDSGLAPQKALTRVDALLSPHGQQIFTPSRRQLGWHVLKRPLRTQTLIEWLRQQGWARVTQFEPESVYGEDARVTFVYQDTGYVTNSVIVLPKASAKADIMSR